MVSCVGRLSVDRLHNKDTGAGFLAEEMELEEVRAGYSEMERSEVKRQPPGAPFDILDGNAKKGKPRSWPRSLLHLGCILPNCLAVVDRGQEN